MKFTRTKLPEEDLGTLKKVPVKLFPVFTLLPTPVYIHLQLNHKLVSIKSPLGYFTPTELKKYERYTDFFLPSFIEKVIPFQRSAEEIRLLMGMKQLLRIRSKMADARQPVEEQVTLPASSQTINNAILRCLCPLWGPDRKVEPFFLALFAHEICSPWDQDALTSATEKSVELYELAVLRSSVAVFFGLHIGISDRAHLSRLRNFVFMRALSTPPPQSPIPSEFKALAEIADRLVKESEAKAIKMADFERPSESSDRVTAKIRSRLKRILSIPAQKGLESPTIFGKEGLIDE